MVSEQKKMETHQKKWITYFDQFQVKISKIMSNFDIYMCELQKEVIATWN